MRFIDWTTPYYKKSFYEVVSITNGQVNPNDEKYRLLPHIGPGNIEKEAGVLLDYNLACQDIYWEVRLDEKVRAKNELKLLKMRGE